MAQIHVVKQGEHLSGIAARYGFGDYRIVWEDPANAALRASRDPHVLFPGDKIVIPERQQRVESGATTQVHLFEVTVYPLYLRLRLRDLNNKPLAGAQCVLKVKVGQDPPPATADPNGFVSFPIDRFEEEAELKVQPKGKPPLTFNLLIGSLNPEHKLSGQQARLNNLGYFAGYNVTDEDQFAWSVEEFQCDKSKTQVTKTPVIVPESEDPAKEPPDKPTGVVDGKTPGKIKAEHGC